MIDLTGGSLNHDQSGEVMETSRPNKITVGSYPRRSFSKGINTIKHALETQAISNANLRIHLYVHLFKRKTHSSKGNN